MLIRYINHLWKEMSSTGRKTFPFDLIRGAANGALVTLQQTFGLLVAIQFFDSSVIEKSVIASSISIGLVMSLFYASWSPLLGKKTLRAGLPSLGTCLGLIIAAYAPNSSIYALGVTIAGICSTLHVPILTGIYRDNYRGKVRGQVYGITVLLMSVMTLLTTFLGGGFLDLAINNYRILFLILAFVALISGFSISMMPDKKDSEPILKNPLSSFSTVKENPAFGIVLTAWFIFGIGNLALAPQRIEFLSQAKYGFSMSPGEIALVLGVTCELVRLPMIQVWARLFDRFNFIKLRIVLNLLLFLHTILYFQTGNIVFVVIGSGLMGASFAGGSIAWNLWVTKFAPPDKTAKYMAVHTFLTGIRGTIGPYLGYKCVEHFGMKPTSGIAAGLILLSIIILWPIRKTITMR
jgi:Major Facilitator Superfamily